MHKGLKYGSFGYGDLELENCRYEHDFGLYLSGKMNPNLGKNKLPKEGKTM